MSSRTIRVNELLRRELGDILRKHYQAEAVAMTVTEVRVAPDLRDAIVFVDATCHGSAKRINPGERRITVYRYGSSWNRTRWGYHASPELLERLMAEGWQCRALLS